MLPTCERQVDSRCIYVCVVYVFICMRKRRRKKEKESRFNCIDLSLDKLQRRTLPYGRFEIIAFVDDFLHLQLSMLMYLLYIYIYMYVYYT